MNFDEVLTPFERRVFMGVFLGLFLFVGVCGYLNQVAREWQERHSTPSADHVAP